MVKLELPEWANCWLTSPTERLPARFDGFNYYDKFGKVINPKGYELHHPEQEGMWIAAVFILFAAICFIGVFV